MHGMTIINCPNERVDVPQTAYERTFSTTETNTKLRHHRSAGLRAQARCGKSIFTTLNVVRAVRGGLPELRWTVITPPQSLCFKQPAKSSTSGKHEKIIFLQQQKRKRALQAAGYRIVEKWQCDYQKQQDVFSKQQTETYSHVSSMILTRNTAKLRETKSASHSDMKMPTCRFQGALATPETVRPRISATQTRKS